VASARSLGCDVVFLEPGAPWKKGMIESFWKAVSQSYLDMFPGKRLRIFDKPGHDYKPEEYAVVSLKAVRTFLTKAIVDIHNQTKDERSGQIRIDRYRRAAQIDPPQPVPPYGDIIELVGGYKSRKASRKGVLIFGMHYNSSDLARYRSDFRDDPLVEVRYSFDDLGSVMVVDRERAIAIRVPCVFRNYATGLTHHQHRVIRRHAIDRGEGGRLYRQHLEAAKADLFRLGNELLGKPKSRKLRQRMAHYFGMSPQTLERVTAKTYDPSADVSPLDQVNPSFGDDDEVFDDEPDIAADDDDQVSDVVGDAERLAEPEDAPGAAVEAEDSVQRPRRRRVRHPSDAERGVVLPPPAETEPPAPPTPPVAAAPDDGQGSTSSRQQAPSAPTDSSKTAPPPPPRAPAATKTRAIFIDWDDK